MRETNITIKDARLKLGITQKELSKKTGISLRTIQAYEQYQRDIYKMGSKKYLKLCEVLKLEPWQLVD